MHIYAHLCICVHIYAYLCTYMHICALLCIFMHTAQYIMLPHLYTTPQLHFSLLQTMLHCNWAFLHYIAYHHATKSLHRNCCTFMHTAQVCTVHDDNSMHCTALLCTFLLCNSGPPKILAMHDTLQALLHCRLITTTLHLGQNAWFFLYCR